jgi:predicted dehydrogenase
MMNEGMSDTRSLDTSIPSPSPSPLGIGLVGLGRWGRNYLKTLLALPECRLVAAADADAATRAGIAGETGIAVRESADELLSDPAVDAVVIATPDRTHYSLAADALAASRDVLVEKPMTLAVSEAETLVRQAEDNEGVLAVGHTAVYSTDLKSLRTRLDALPGVAPRHVVAERTSSGPASVRQSLILNPQSAIFNLQSSIIYDLCPHDIALAVLLFGTPVAARASSSGNSVEYEVRFEDDSLLSGRAEWREPPHIRRFAVAGARELAEPANPTSAECQSPTAIRHSPLGRQCLDFIESCRTRRQPLSNGRLGLAVIRCISALAASCTASSAWVQIGDLVHRPSSFVSHSEPGRAEHHAEVA